MNTVQRFGEVRRRGERNAGVYEAVQCSAVIDNNNEMQEEE